MAALHHHHLHLYHYLLHLIMILSTVMKILVMIVISIIVLFTATTILIMIKDLPHLYLLQLLPLITRIVVVEEIILEKEVKEETLFLFLRHL
jgi:hypothetical protein